MADLPTKLKHDAIIEALAELRFESDDDVPELVIAKLAGCAGWATYKPVRLPAADLPAVIRNSDANLRYQPLLELQRPDGVMSVKIGTHALSCHVTKKYMGWAAFRPVINEAVSHVFKALSNASVRRIGLRYINAFVPTVHGITKVSDLNMGVLLGTTRLLEPYNVNYRFPVSSGGTCQVRVASPEFVSGFMPGGTSALIDVDVFTPDGFTTDATSQVMSWVDAAHQAEKQAFFDLLRPEQIQALRDDGV